MLEKILHVDLFIVSMEILNFLTTHLNVLYTLPYRIRLSHIFEIPSISNEKPCISIEIVF